MPAAPASTSTPAPVGVPGDDHAPVTDKSKANTCPSYAARLVLDATGRRTGPTGGASNDPKSQFENLFKR
jgi:hypothetical protein